MLVLDSKGQENWREAAKAEADAALRRRVLAEEILSNTISVADDGSVPTDRLEAQLGRPLAALEVQRRLKLCCPALIFEVSTADATKTGIYIETNERNSSGSWQKRKTFLCGMESGISPEMSVIHKQIIKVPNPDLLGQKGRAKEVEWLEIPTFQDETRGWRTVLVRLLHLGIIKERDVDVQFGWSPTRESKNWKERTHG